MPQQIFANIVKKSEIVFITTSDGAIEEACNKIASDGGFNPGSVVFHTCGALPSNILKSARKKGAKVASLHPLQSLANVKEAVKNLQGSYFCIEGDESAISVAREIVAVLRGKEITLNVYKKTFYHAGACAVSNFFIATVGFGLELFEAAGIEQTRFSQSTNAFDKGYSEKYRNCWVSLQPLQALFREEIQGLLKITSRQ